MEVAQPRLHNFQVSFPGVCATSGLLYPEVAQYPGIVTRRLDLAEKFESFSFQTAINTLKLNIWTKITNG